MAQAIVDVEDGGDVESIADASATSIGFAFAEAYARAEGEVRASSGSLATAVARYSLRA